MRPRVLALGCCTALAVSCLLLRRLRRRRPTGLVLPRPQSAVGTFLRILTINDIYTIENYPRFRRALDANRAAAGAMDCVVISTLAGDFLSPSTFTCMDGGSTLAAGVNHAGLDFVSLGNHEFDLDLETVRAQIATLSAEAINSNVDEPALAHLPRHALVRVGRARTAVLAGAVTDDKRIYTRSYAMRPVTAALVAAWDEATAASGGRLSDVFIPMTHQLMKDDRATAAALGKHAALRSRTPIILGGHEHDAYVEQQEGQPMILKTGCDAQRIGVVDVWWRGDGALRCAASLLPTDDYEPEPTAAAWAEAKRAELAQIMQAELTRLPRAISSKPVRSGPSGVASFLCSCVKRALSVELAISQGGVCRGAKDYEAGHAFTMADLFAEYPTGNMQAVVPLPGRVLRDALRFTRSRPKPTPSFLHCDDDATVSDAHELTAINGAPLEPDRVYTVAINRNLLTGLDDVEPLVAFVEETSLQVPERAACPTARELLLSFFSQKT